MFLIIKDLRQKIVFSNTSQTSETAPVKRKRELKASIYAAVGADEAADLVTLSPRTG